MKVIDSKPWNPFDESTKHAELVTLDRKIEVHDYDEAVSVAVFHVFRDRNELFPWHIVPTLVEHNQVLVSWTEDNEEREITPRFVFTGTGDPEEEPHESVIYQMYEVGDIVYFEAGAPGVGHQRFIVDRKDDKGLYGRCIEDTIWVPD